MHGKMQEWCADWWAEDYYATSQADDPTGPSTGAYHVFRGGCLYSDMRRYRAADRSGNPPNRSNEGHGFRVVAVPSGNQ